MKGAGLCNVLFYTGITQAFISKTSGITNPAEKERFCGASGEYVNHIKITDNNVIANNSTLLTFVLTRNQ